MRPMPLFPKQLASSSRSLSTIPDDLLLELLSFLSPTHLLANVACVCRSWQKLIQTSRLWKPSFFVLHSRQVPKERTCHTAVVHKDRMYVLGGMDKSNTIHGIKKELAILSFDTMTWTQITTDVPGLTEHSCIVWRQSLVVFGGYFENNAACCNHLFEGSLDGPRPAFRQLKTFGDEPRARSAHVALLHDDKMYISGGWNCRFTVTFDDLYSLDLTTHVWEQLPPSPHAARAHCGFVYGDSIYLFGGCNNENQSLSELQRYDIRTQRWCIQPVKGDVPLGRSRCRGVLYQKHFILIGGWNRQVYYDELYVLNVEHMVWTKVGTHSMPAVVQHSVVLNGDRLYSFAGFVRRNQSQLAGPKEKEVRPSDGDHSSDDGSGKKHAHKKKKLDPSLPPGLSHTPHHRSQGTQTGPEGFEDAPSAETSPHSPGPPAGPWEAQHTPGGSSSSSSSSSSWPDERSLHLMGDVATSSNSSGFTLNGHLHHVGPDAEDHPRSAEGPAEDGCPFAWADGRDTHQISLDPDQQSDSNGAADMSSSAGSDDDTAEAVEEGSEMDADLLPLPNDGPLPANPTPEQQTREDGMGQLCNTLYCYLCFHAVGA